MRHAWWIILAVMMFGCADPGIEAQEQKEVPNETPKQYMEEVPQNEQSSTAEIQEQVEEQRRRAEAASNHAVSSEEIETELNKNVDLRGMTTEQRKEAISEFSKRYAGSSLLPEPDVGVRDGRKSFSQPTMPPDPLERKSRMEFHTGVEQPMTPKKTEGPRPPGGRLFTPRQRASGAGEEISTLLPPGRFFKARMVGTASVSVFAPTIFAKIFNQEGESIGLAVGKAQLHRVLKDRALFNFTQIYLDDGRVLQGTLRGFDLDLSEGVMGRVERKTFKKIMLWIVETMLGVMALEVDVEGDGFGQVFKFNLAQKLLDEANNSLRTLDLERLVIIERDTSFWVTSTTEMGVRQRDYAVGFDDIATHARDAFERTLEAKNYQQSRRDELQAAYKRLESRLQDLPDFSTGESR